MSERVPTQFVRTLLRLAADKGVATAPILSAAGLDFDPLAPESPDYRDQVSAMQYSRVYQHVLRHLQDDRFGFGAQGSVSPGAFRMLCYCLIPSENLGRAIGRAAEFNRTFFDESSQLYANFTERHARVGYRHMPAGAGQPVGAADGYGLSVWHRFFSWLCGRHIDLDRVDFIGAPPRHPEKYRELFGCSVYYGQANNLLYFDSEYLSLPVVHTEESLEEFLRTAPYQLLMMDARRGSEKVVSQVRAMMGHDFSRGFPPFDSIAQALNMSAPTLRRRLRREGVTFQQLKDQCRCEAARLYLKRPRLPISEVAYLLGFTDASAFHRAFRKWTGQTPGQFRADAGNEESLGNHAA